jgi:hypothetical protein
MASVYPLIVLCLLKLILNDAHGPFRDTSAQKRMAVDLTTRFCEPFLIPELRRGNLTLVHLLPGSQNTMANRTTSRLSRSQFSFEDLRFFDTFI